MGKVGIRGKHLQPPIVYGTAYGEVIQRLQAEIGNPQHLVHDVIEKAADPRAAHSHRFRFKI